MTSRKVIYPAYVTLRPMLMMFMKAKLIILESASSVIVFPIHSQIILKIRVKLGRNYK